ncbi:hypothetical protein BXZ70DRAFT_392211 [Cristinia sonorae]|uniref:Uncharacterized protein n=1 Tax=Cristinia sonorae TaxID=1940300 RepID=A0A8K0XMJ9_9AGAR|nr:hypothetical protein BXZ70DRAFT_392211 [Cristinia sonorae]
MARVDVFRSGNASSPRFDNFRDKDFTFDAQGNLVPHKGGVSTFGRLQDLPSTKNAWRLPSTAPLGTGVEIFNDRDTHWSIRPSVTQTKDQWIAKMATLNTKATKVAQVAAADAERVSTVLRESKHDDKLTRFVINALADVHHKQLPVSDWDDNDYAYIGILAGALERGDLALDEVRWKNGSGGHTKEQYFVAEAVGVHIKAQNNAAKAKQDEDEEADWMNDVAVLRVALGANEEENPLRKLII